MNRFDKVNSIQEVERVANTLFPCRVKVDKETRGYERKDGKRTFQLIVGEKANPAYDPRFKSGPRSKKTRPDKRIIYLPANIIAGDLVRYHLQRIADSLKTKEPVIDKQITSIEKQPTEKQYSDEELLKQLQEGKIESDWEDDITGDAKLSDTEKQSIEDNITETLNIFNENIETLAKDLKDINNRLKKLEKSETEKSLEKPKVEKPERKSK